MPLYPISIFQGENDGEGMCFVMYFKLSEGYSKELPHTSQSPQTPEVLKKDNRDRDRYKDSTDED